MTRYRLDPGEIDAVQWFENGDHPDDYAETVRSPNGVDYGPEYRREHNWEGDVIRYYRHPDVAGDRMCGHCAVPMHEHGWIDSGGDGRTVCPGDWVITTEDGSRYPMKPDIFDVVWAAL